MGLVNIQNTNFENGVTNRNAADLFGSMGQLDPTKFSTYMDDFNAPGIDETGNNTLQGYTAPATGAVAAAASELGAAVTLTSGATDNDVAIIRSTALGFNVVASTRLYYRARLQVDDILLSDVVAGLSDDATDTTPTDGIIFVKDEASGAIDLRVFSTTLVASSVAVATMVNATMLTLEFYWDGIDRVYFGVNGVPTGFIDLSGVTLPTGFLGSTLGVIAREAVAKVVTCDYLFASQER